MVHRADRLTDVICGMRSNGLEPKRLCLCHADGKAPYLFMIEAVKGGKSGLKITPSVVNQAFGNGDAIRTGGSDSGIERKGDDS